MAEPKIKSREDLETWLADKPADWAQAIAARAALRVLPLTFFDVGAQKPGKTDPRVIILQSFRASFISWAARKYPAHEMRAAAARATDVAAAATDAARATDVAAAATDAAAAATDAAAAAAAATAAATDAAAAAAAATATAAAATAATAAAAAAAAAAAYATAAAAYATASAAAWNAVDADCAWLDKHPTSVGLIGEPLWLVDVRGDERYRANMPPWARRPFDAFSASAEATSWHAIIDWYRAILPSASDTRPRSLFREAADIALATQQGEFWTVTDERTPDVIMGEVAGIVGWGLRKSRPDKTIAAFIIDFLEAQGTEATIEEIRDAFRGADYSVVDKTMRGELSRLAKVGRIDRLRTGVYRAPVPMDDPIDLPPPTVRQGTGPVFAAVEGRLARVPSLPSDDERHDATLQKIHERLNKRLGSLLGAFGNGLARYPELSTILDDYRNAISPERLADVDIVDVWISGVGVIAQARSFAAIDPSRQVTEPLEPQLQALLGEVARLHGAFIMGFAEGRELAERSGIPLLTPEEFRTLFEQERTIVRWLVETNQFAMSDHARLIFEEIDHYMRIASVSTEEMAKVAYPIIRNLIVLGANGLQFSVKVVAGVALTGLPVHLAVNGMAVFLQENMGPSSLSPRRRRSFATTWSSISAGSALTSRMRIRTKRDAENCSRTPATSAPPPTPRE